MVMMTFTMSRTVYILTDCIKIALQYWFHTMNVFGEAMTGKLSEIKFCLQNRSNLIPSYQQHHEKPAQCKFEKQSAGQLPSHCTADQHVCFPYINRTIPLLLKFKKFKSDHFFMVVAWFVPHLVRTPE